MLDLPDPETSAEPFAREVLDRLPLAEATLSLWAYVLQPALLERVFDRYRGRSFEDLLGFPRFVDLIADALIRHHGSGRQSFIRSRARRALPTCPRAVYGKLARVPLSLSIGFFEEATASMRPLLPEATAVAALPACLDGMTTVVLDGKKIKGAAKRLKPLRSTPGGVFGGKLLVAYLPRRGLAVAMAADPDGEANDIELVPEALNHARARIDGPRLWVADRQFRDPDQPPSVHPHAFLGFLFGIDDSAVGRDINPLQPLLAGIFRIPERPTRRPGEGQREYYSGEKKRHTLKNQVVTARRAKPPGPGEKPRRLRIAAVCETHPGGVHDKKMYDRARVVAPPDARRTGDTAYLGTGLETPTRKPRGGELTAAQKERNGRIARRRVVAEHGIGEMKIWRIAAERYRNPEGRHTLILKDVAGLHNLMHA